VTRRWWLAWGALALVLVVALAVGSRGSGHAGTGDRVSRIASEVRCPTCAGQSAEQSDAPAAKAVRAFIAEQVQAGQTDGQIERQLRDRYGSDILLRPPASGVAGLVWVLPVAGLVLALAGLAFAFRRWRSSADVPVTERDRTRVEAALAERVGSNGSSASAAPGSTDAGSAAARTGGGADPEGPAGADPVSSPGRA